MSQQVRLRGIVRGKRNFVGVEHVKERRGVLTPGSLVPQSPHFGGLPFFLVCWYWSFPPGVLTIRTLLERVLYLVVSHQ